MLFPFVTRLENTYKQGPGDANLEAIDEIFQQKCDSNELWQPMQAENQLPLSLQWTASSIPQKAEKRTGRP